jgi:hypothetical protein
VACERCHVELPPLRQLGPDDRVACFVATGEAEPASAKETVAE